MLYRYKIWFHRCIIVSAARGRRAARRRHAAVPVTLQSTPVHYRGGPVFARAHTNTRAFRALAMLVLGRAVSTLPTCAKSAPAHSKMSPLLRANWQNFFPGSTRAPGRRNRLRTAARQCGPKKP